VTLLEAVLVFVAGIGAGTINTIVGSGTLITFPMLLAVGYPPVQANVSNTVGLVLGSVSGALGYRRELEGQRARLIRLGVGSALGGIAGALLLLKLPSAAFKAIVPALIAAGCVLVLAQPWIARRLRPRTSAPAHGSALVWTLVFLTGVYGGYFGAAQGVILIAVLGLGFADSLQRINAAKNVFAGVANAVSALVFIVVSDIAWTAAALIAVGSILGGVIGASVGRRLPQPALRIVVAIVGLAAIVKLVVFD
jgi:uncharacterized membrane protein YfcA